MNPPGNKRIAFIGAGAVGDCAVPVRALHIHEVQS
jgi:hypothetical protein